MKYIFSIFLVMTSLSAKDLSFLIPLYSYPTYWNDFTDRFEFIKDNNITTYAVINPYNGPGYGYDGDDNFTYNNYVSGVELLKSYNIHPIGYVHTTYGDRNISQVKNDIDLWLKYYDVEGIFFDETSTSEHNISYYKSLTDYAKEKGFNFNILNPGVATHQQYIDENISEVVITYENYHVAFLTDFTSNPNTENENTSLALLLHTMSIDGFANAYEKAKEHGFSYVYFTEDSLKNPWDDLSGYFFKDYEKKIDMSPIYYLLN